MIDTGPRKLEVLLAICKFLCLKGPVTLLTDICIKLTYEISHIWAAAGNSIDEKPSHIMSIILFCLIYIQTTKKLCLDNDGSIIESLEIISFSEYIFYYNFFAF